MEKTRDWELVPISQAVGRKFGYDIFPTEFKSITGNLSLVQLSAPIFLKAKAGAERRAPIIKKGAEVTEKIVETFTARNCTVLPVLVPGTPKPLNALTSFAHQQSLMLAGRVFSCVDQWLDRLRKDRAVNVIQAVRKYRTPLLQSLNGALKDWEAVTITLVNDILVADERLTILSLFDDFIGSQEKRHQQKQHSIDVTVLALILAKKCNLPVYDIKELGIAALIHDIGMVVFEQKLQELLHDGGQILEPDIIREYYNRHPIYGAVLLSKKNGEPLAGISEKARTIILEHEQKINGAGPRITDPEMANVLKAMGIPEKVRYVGDNRVFPDLSRPREMVFPETGLVRRLLTIQSQVLHISELYVTTLDRFKRRGVRDPHKETIRIMVKQAGEQINGEIFEVFFNHLIPVDYYPENLMVSIQLRGAEPSSTYRQFKDYSGVILSVSDESGNPRKMLHLLKNPDGSEAKERYVFDLAYEKRYMYLRIDDWSQYSPPR